MTKTKRFRHYDVFEMYRRTAKNQGARQKIKVGINSICGHGFMRMDQAKNAVMLGTQLKRRNFLVVRKF